MNQMAGAMFKLWIISMFLSPDEPDEPDGWRNV